MKFLSSVVFVLATVCNIRLGEATVPTECVVPPNYWCDTPEIAALCGVTEQCDHLNQTMWNRKLRLQVVYETLCPQCQYYVSKWIYAKVWVKLRDIVDIELLPFGNAMETKANGTYYFTCQHGETECKLNMFHACIIHILKKPALYMPLIACLEGTVKMTKAGKAGIEKSVEKCFVDEDVRPDLLPQTLDCQKGPLGIELEHIIAEKTDASWPSEHAFTPWLQLNGLSTNNLQTIRTNLPAALCNFYKGSELPDACDSYLHFH